MASSALRTCGRCRDVTDRPFVPEGSLDELARSGEESVFGANVIRCIVCADDEQRTHRAVYVAYAAVDVVRTHGDRRRTPPDVIAQYRHVPMPDFPAGC